MKTNNMSVNMVGNKGMMSDSNNNAVVDLNGVKLAIDAGITVKNGYGQAGIRFTDIEYLFLTHADPDHSQIVFFLQQTYWQFPNGVHTPHRPTLLVLPEQQQWIQDYTKHTLGTQGLTLGDYVNVVVVENRTYEIHGFRIDFVDTTNLHCHGMQSFGLVISHLETGENIIYTSDIKKMAESGFKNFLNEHTLAIFQDCHANGDPVHAGFLEVLDYYPEAFHNRLFLMHLTGDFSVHTAVMQEKGISLTEAATWVEI